MALLFTTIGGDLLALLATLLVACFVRLYRRYSYFERLGVPYEKPVPIIGNLLPVLLKRESLASVLRPAYEKYRDVGYFGVFNWWFPNLVVCDPELIKQLLTKNFAAFHDRGMAVDETSDPLSANLFHLSGAKWRNLRNRLTPTFTSGKMKMMYPLMVDVGNNLSAVVRKMIEEDNNVEFVDLIAKYSTDLIGTCAFGITCNCLSEGNKEFLEASREVTKPSLRHLVHLILSSIHPVLARIVPIEKLFPRLADFFLNLMKDTVEYRDQNKVERNDFVQLMMKIRDKDKKGLLDRDNFIELTHGVMTAQALVFFVAALDNVANTVSFALHELALNPELQERTAQEVRDTIAKNNGEMTYEAVKQMDLVGRITYEALRKWTPLGILFRKCNTSTTLGSTGLVVPKDLGVFIPISALHLDPSLYPDPERFDPDRFTEEARNQRHPYAYLPFGEGPRMCIAERFAMMEMKVCLASLLRDFKFSVGSRTEVKPELVKASFGPRPKNGMWLKVDEREKTVR